MQDLCCIVGSWPPLTEHSTLLICSDHPLISRHPSNLPVIGEGRDNLACWKQEQPLADPSQSYSDSYVQMFKYGEEAYADCTLTLIEMPLERITQLLSKMWKASCKEANT